MESRNGVLRDGVPRFRAAAIAGGAILTLDALWLVFGFGGAWATNARSDVVGILVTVAAGVVCWTTARGRLGPPRRAWRLLGIGAFAWGAGRCVAAFYEFV